MTSIKLVDDESLSADQSDPYPSKFDSSCGLLSSPSDPMEPRELDLMSDVVGYVEGPNYYKIITFNALNIETNHFEPSER